MSFWQNGIARKNQIKHSDIVLSHVDRMSLANELKEFSSCSTTRHDAKLRAPSRPNNFIQGQPFEPATTKQISLRLRLNLL